MAELVDAINRKRLVKITAHPTKALSCRFDSCPYHTTVFVLIMPRTLLTNFKQLALFKNTIYRGGLTVKAIKKDLPYLGNPSLGRHYLFISK